MFRHLLPNTVAPIVVAATLGIPSAILSEAGHQLPRSGRDPADAELGIDDQRSDPEHARAPYMLIFPAMALSLTVLAFNFLGDGLRDALDPWMKR